MQLVSIAFKTTLPSRQATDYRVEYFVARSRLNQYVFQILSDFFVLAWIA